MLHSTVSMKEILQLLMVKKKLIFLIVFYFTFAGGIISVLTPPVYEAQADILIGYSGNNDGKTPVTASEIDITFRLVESYKELMMSNHMMKRVTEEFQTTYTKNDLLNKIKVDSNSQILSIIVREDTPEKAARLSNKFAEIFLKEVQSLMPYSSTHLLNEATVGIDTKRVRPIPLLYIISAFGMGLLMSFSFVLARETYFPLVNSERKVEQALNVGLLGTIPELKGKRNLIKKEIQLVEAIQRLRGNLQVVMAEQKVKSIVITSTSKGDGKSYICYELAKYFARNHQRTIYIDADLRSGKGTELFQLNTEDGLTSYLDGTMSISDIIIDTIYDNLSFIGSGNYTSNPIEFFSSERMHLLLSELKKHYDVILLDAPSLTFVDPYILSRTVDRYLYVVNVKKTRMAQAFEDLKQLRRMDANVIGAVLNYCTFKK